MLTGRHGSGVVAQAQAEPERRARTERALDRDLGTVRGHDPLHDREPEAHAVG